MAGQAIKAYLNQYFGEDIENIMPYTFQVTLKNDVLFAALNNVNGPKKLDSNIIMNCISLLWSAPYLVIRFVRKSILFGIDQASKAVGSTKIERSSPLYQLLKACVNIIFFVPEIIVYGFSIIGDILLGTIILFGMTIFINKKTSDSPVKKEIILPLTQSISDASKKSLKEVKASSTVGISQKIIANQYHKDINELKAEVIEDLKFNRVLFARRAELEKGKSSKDLDLNAVEALLVNLELRQQQKVPVAMYAEKRSDTLKQQQTKNKAKEIECMQLQSDLDSLNSILRLVSTHADLYGRALVVAGQINDRLRLLTSSEIDQQQYGLPKTGEHDE